MKIRETPKYYVVHYPRYEVWEGNSGYVTTADVYYSKDKWEKAAKYYGYTDPRPGAAARYGMTIAEVMVGAVTPSRVRLGAGLKGSKS